MNEVLVVVVRGLIAFFTLLIFTRLLGKQEISQLTYFDYINGITIGSIAASLTTNLNNRAFTEWMGLATWTGAVLLLHIITLNSRYLSKYLDGEPTIVIMNGKIMDSAMKKMRYRLSELMAQLRMNNVFDISQVEFAILETSGKLSVLKKSSYQPVTPHDLNIPTKYMGLSIELISDGKIIDQNLKQINLDRYWLEDQLKAKGINDPSEVFLAVIDTQGNLYIDKYDDPMENPINISDYYGPN
ncbi:MAG: DUF421 domain-containing protein [Clostridia bacterium]|nr:DUF421 domain-containing protein [Clostridia bacterium]